MWRQGYEESEPYPALQSASAEQQRSSQLLLQCGRGLTLAKYGKVL